MYIDCPACKSANPPGSEFCGECGTLLVPAGDPSEPQQPEKPVPEASPEAEQAPTAPEQLQPPPLEGESGEDEPPPAPGEEPPFDHDQLVPRISPDTFEEHVYYEAEGIRITRNQAVLGGETYDMADVSSVWSESKPAKRITGIVVLVIGLSVMSCFVFAGDDLIIKLLLAFGGLAAVVLGVLLATLGRSEYTVRIKRASGEIGEFTSESYNQVAEIVRALDSAIASRR